MFEYYPIDADDDKSPSAYEYIIESRKNDTQWEIPLSKIADNHLLRMKSKELNRDWRLNEFFETIAVINLPHAKERLQKVSQELRDIGTTSFITFPAIDGSQSVDPEIWNKFYLNLHDIDTSTEEGIRELDSLHQRQAGCYMSHYKLILTMKNAYEASLAKLDSAIAENDAQAIESAKKEVRKYSRILILEDDAGFGILDKKKSTVSKKGVGKILRKALSELPSDWDMLYFVVNATEPTKRISSCLRQLNDSWCMVNYAVRYSMYAPLIELLRKIEDPSVRQIKPIDAEIGRIHHLHNVYAIYPSIAFTQGGKSYITGREWSAWQGQPIYRSRNHRK